MNDIDDSNG